MNKYKVEIEEVSTYVIDVEAKDEGEARKKATQKWTEVCANGAYHYYESEDPNTETTTVYDVTNTDDPFNP